MIEALILSVCLNGSEAACSSAATAYYRHTGIERLLTSKSAHFSAQYPATSLLIAAVAQAGTGHIVLPLDANRSLTWKFDSATINYKVGF